MKYMRTLSIPHEEVLEKHQEKEYEGDMKKEQLD